MMIRHSNLFSLHLSISGTSTSSRSSSSSGLLKGELWLYLIFSKKK